MGARRTSAGPGRAAEGLTRGRRGGWLPDHPVGICDVVPRPGGRRRGRRRTPSMTAATGETARHLGPAPEPVLLDDAERMGVDELRVLQLERLQRTLRHVYANVPHYR